MRQLAAEEGISAPALSGHLDRLERAGLIERVRSEDDRRRVALVLTNEGATVFGACGHSARRGSTQRLRDLEPGELGKIEAALEPLRRLL